MIKFEGIYFKNNFMAGSIPNENPIVADLNNEMKKPTPVQSRIKWLLDRLRLEYPNDYDTLKSERTSVVHQAEAHLNSLLDDVEWIVVPGFILGHPEAKGNMEKFWKIENGVFIPENEEIKRDFDEYKDLMGFIENTPRNQTQSIIDMEWLVSRYEKLLAPTNSRFIRWADYLTAMYGEALYEDIIARGFIYKRDGDRRSYEIVCPEVVNGVYTEKDLADEFPNHPYLRLLKRIEVNDMMDMMVVGSIMVKDKISYRSMDLVGQDDLVKTILAKHNIKWPDGRDILNPQLLLVHWETPVTNGPLAGKTIKQQVLDKRNDLVKNKDDGGSWQAYQELQYVLDFMENEDYLDTDRSLNMFQFANQYRKAFLGRQAYIDAGWPDGTGITEKNIFDHLGNFAEGNVMASLWVAFVAWFTGHNQTALFATIFWLMWGTFADAGSNLLNEGKWYVKSWTKEQLGILDPQDVRYNIKTPDGIDESDIRPQLDKLFIANESDRDNGWLTNNTLTRTLSNAKIAKIYQSILGNDALLTQWFSNNTATVNTIRGLLGTPPKVTAGDFDSIIPSSELGSISDADITAALTLMENTLKEEWDTTFGDVVYSGIDPLKKPYTPAEYWFLWDSSEEFEGMLNTLLSTARSNATTRVEIAQIEKVKTTLASIFVGEWIGDLWEITQRIQSTLLLTEANEASEAIQTLTLIPDADLNIGWTDYKTQLIDAITKYRGYAEVDEFLNPYDGTWAETEDAAEWALNRLKLLAEGRSWITLANIDRADRAIESIDEDLLLFANPAAIKVAQWTRTVDISTDPEYAPLLERFNDIKDELEAEKRKYETLKENIVNGTIAWLGWNPNILTPSEQTDYESKFREADIRDLQAIADEVTRLSETIEQGNVNAPSDLSRYINTYGSALARLRWIELSIQWVTLQAAGTPENRLQQAIKNSISSTISGEWITLLNTIKTELTEGFEALKDVQDRLNGITVTSSSSITELETSMTILTSIWWSLDTLVSGTFDGASNNETDIEKAYSRIEEVFGAPMTIPNSNITGRTLYELSQEKIEEVTDQVRAKAVDDTTSLDDLYELYDTWLIEKADEINPRLGLRADVKRSIETKIEQKINSHTTVEDVIDYMEWNYEDHRKVFRWSYEWLTGNLDSDEQITERLKDKLEQEINALPLDITGLNKAKELAPLMWWLPPRSTAGRWREVMSENFTDFTGFFGESDIEQEFNDKLGEVREAIMRWWPDSSSHLYSTLDNLARSLAASDPTKSRRAADYRDGTLDINALMQDVDFKDLPEVWEALRKDYLID